ncbi:MAG TPA: HAMP domain-containing sensor histidine kinase [Candidatus Bathyarchaeia archaeon]|nr:HAMP domain-containing sensor histidine kinase [Candidatus Bathyarchaeia archaeon]
MKIAQKLFLFFLAIIALNLLTYKFVFEDIIVEQLKNDRHEQFKQEREAANRVRINQLIRTSTFKDPTELRELTEKIPEDLMYKMIVEDAQGDQIFTKSSKAYKEVGTKVVAEYYYQHELPERGATIIRFYTDDSEILATKGVSMIVMYIYGSVLVVGLVFMVFLVRWILKPVNELALATQEIKSGKRNVTFTYKRKDEFLLLFRSFVAMVDQLRYSDERQQELISAIAHDFRTPLTTIKGYASYIASGRVTDLERIQKQMKKIEQKAEDMDRLLEELQDYSHLSTNQALHMGRVHIRSFMQNIAEEYSEKAKEAGLQFQTKIRVSNELYIEADEKKLRRVMQNLLNNAIYYNKVEGSILVTCDQREHHVLFSVIDKGEGISQEDLAKIFTKFYRAEKSRNRNNGGTGLGLTICKSIVEQHGGQISATSELGEGSCFSFTIPFYPKEAASM